MTETEKSTEANGTAAEAPAEATAAVTVAKVELSEAELAQRDAKIVRQMEYYFGNFNMPKDKFLQQQIKLDDGWVPMATMLKFKRLASICKDEETIFEALKKSSQSVLEVNAEDKKIRRSVEQPLPVYDDKLKEEIRQRTVYCKGFPKDGSMSLDKLLAFFLPYGPYETVKMRHYVDVKDQRGFKGSVQVVFPTREKAEEFLAVNSVEHNGVELIRKWENDYWEEKKKEIEARKALKDEKKKNKEEEKTEEPEKEADELPKGTFLHAGGFTPETQREDVKEAIAEFTDQLAFIEYTRGDPEAFLRFKEPESNKSMLECLKGHLKVKDVEITLRLVEGEEEDEQLKKAQEARNRSRARANAPKRRRFGGGWRGKNKRGRN